MDYPIPADAFSELDNLVLDWITRHGVTIGQHHVEWTPEPDNELLGYVWRRRAAVPLPDGRTAVVYIEIEPPNQLIDTPVGKFIADSIMNDQYDRLPTTIEARDRART